MEKEKRLGKEERMRHVVETAKALFIRQGYSATSTSQIARESGIVEMTLFRYFPTKKELFEAVVAPLISFEWFPLADLADETLPKKSLILTLLHKRVEFAKQERDLVRLLIIESQFEPELAGEYNPVTKAASQLNNLLIKLGLNEGTAQTIITLLMGVILTIAFAPYYDEQAIDQAFRHIETEIIDLIDKQ